MKPIRHPDGSWWLDETGDASCPEYGPYESKSKANASKRRLQRGEKEAEKKWAKDLEEQSNV